MPTKINKHELTEKIPGWGVDLKPENRPGVPKEKKPHHGTGAHWQEPEQQKPTVKIYKTIERQTLTRVFGTSCPPKGLSGKVRAYAYRLPEGMAMRWLSLLVADRIDVIESILSDVVNLRAGNPIKEMGLQVELKERGSIALGMRKKLAFVLGLGPVKSATAYWVGGEKEKVRHGKKGTSLKVA